MCYTLAVVRPFTPRDALRLRRQQQTGTCLELESTVLLGGSPLAWAMRSCWPVGDRPLRTYVARFLDGHAPDGFAQARTRRRGADADLVFVAPALDETPRAALGWHRLLTEVCQDLGARGVQRLHVAVPDEDQLLLQVARQLGFAVAAGDAVLRRPAGRLPAAIPDTPTRPEADADRHAIESWLFRGWPEPVRLARETADGAWDDYPVGGHAGDARLRRVWLDARGAPRAAWRLYTGPGGSWLRLAVAADADAGPAVRQALAEARSVCGDTLPIHAAARGYEPALHLALREHGFTPVARRFRLVKTMTALVREPVWRLAGLREAAGDAAPLPSVELAACAPAPASSRRPS